MIISVNGFEEAKNYPVMFNTSEILMDNNRDVFYLKSVDAMGKYTLRTYEFTQVENDQPAVVTQEQFNQLQSKIDTLLNRIGGIENGQQHFEQPATANTNATQQPNASAVSTIQARL